MKRTYTVDYHGELVPTNKRAARAAVGLSFPSRRAHHSDEPLPQRRDSGRDNKARTNTRAKQREAKRAIHALFA